MTDPDLSALQHWLQAVITAPGALPQQLHAAERQSGLSAAEVVRADDRVPAGRRLHVYASGYRLRLLECLEAGYPALYRFLGPDLFRQFATGYLQWQPPASYTLSDLDAGFASFLEATRPPGADAVFALPGALARLERARLEALRAPGFEEETAGEMDWSVDHLLLDPPLVALPPCCRVLALPFDLPLFYEALLRGESPPLPEARPAYLAVSRVQYRLQVTTLTEAEYAFAQAAATSQPLFAALAQASGSPGPGSAFAALAPSLPRLHAGGVLRFFA